MTTQFEVDSAAVAAKEQRDRNVALLRDWLATTHPEIPPSIAVDKLFESYMDFESEDLTPAQFEFALGNLESQIGGRQHVPSEDELKQNIIDKICDLLNVDEFQKRNERTKLQFQSLVELSGKLNKLLARRELASKSGAELREIAKGPQAVPSQFPGYPNLTSTYVPKYPVPALGWDTIRAVPTGEYLRYLAKKDLATFKTFTRLYSGAQITFWLNQ
jgi:hypothetical protein